MKTLANHLYTVLQNHDKIIVGVDFDDTIFSLSSDVYIEKRCKEVRELIKRIKSFSIICLYTIADSQSLQYKLALMEEWGIFPDYVNCSPVVLSEDKPYFNVLLDDKAGIEQVIEELNKLINILDEE